MVGQIPPLRLRDNRAAACCSVSTKSGRPRARALAVGVGIHARTEGGVTRSPMYSSGRCARRIEGAPLPRSSRSARDFGISVLWPMWVGVPGQPAHAALGAAGPAEPALNLSIGHKSTG